jgi:hypothetical protein
MMSTVADQFTATLATASVLMGLLLLMVTGSPNGRSCEVVAVAKQGAALVRCSRHRGRR